MESVEFSVIHTFRKIERKEQMATEEVVKSKEARLHDIIKSFVSPIIYSFLVQNLQGL